jgi:predicted transposase YbfD/YdcC
VRAQRETGAKTNEIPELAPAITHLNLTGAVVTLDALHTQAETARHLVEDKHGHYLMIIKGNQPSLLAATTRALAGPDSGFAAASWAEEGTGHGRRERRAIRTAPADGISWPHAAQIMRIRRDTGPTHGPWEHKEIAYGITSLPPDLAGPRHLGIYARQHWAIENREHYVRTRHSAKTCSRPAPGTSRTPTPPSATWSPAHAAAPDTPTSPTPAAITAATTSASSPCTDTPEQTSRTRDHNPSARRPDLRELPQEKHQQARPAGTSPARSSPHLADAATHR